jgi:predicted transcriptional regulator
MKFIIETLNGYQIMPTEHLRNKELSLKAKGLLSIMYSLPNDWDYSMNGLCIITNTGITAIRNIIAELELKGYLLREQKKNEKGQFEYIYRVFFKKRTVKPTKEVLSLKRFKTALNKLKK